MAKNSSAGILLYRIDAGALEVFLVHPGGPFWAKKDSGAWSIPKGEFDRGDEPLEVAKREFLEETGSPVDGAFIELPPLRQPGGKLIYGWAIKGNIDPSSIRSNTFAMEWPPRSGTQQMFPEVDRSGWFTVPKALEKLLRGQHGFVHELEKKLKA